MTEPQLQETSGAWIPPEIAGIPDTARDLMRRALETDDYREFQWCCQEAGRLVWMVGRCPNCKSPIGSKHYCGGVDTVRLAEVVRA